MKRYLFSDNEYKLLSEMKMPLGIYQFIDGKVVTLLLSKGFLDLFNYTEDEMDEACAAQNGGMREYTHPDDADRVYDAAIAFALNDIPYEVIYRTKTKRDNRYKIIHATAEHVYMKDTRLAYMWYTCEGFYDETNEDSRHTLGYNINRALHEESILRASYYDKLTGFPSMSSFFELAERYRISSLKANKDPVMLFMDLRGMKFYNQKYGFNEGDHLLEAFSKLIESYFGIEHASRFSGDHFLVFTDSEGLEEKLNRFFDDVAKLNNGSSLPVQVGIYFSSIDPVDASTACDRAKVACEQLKSSYNSGFNYFDIGMLEKMEMRQYIVDNFEKAMENRWIQVYYQVIVRAVNGYVCDEEALARWIDPEKGFLSPADFIPILEDAKLIYKLDLYVLDRIIEKIQFVKNMGLYSVPQSINLSRTDFECCDMVTEIKDRLDKAGLDHSNITIEITESVIGTNLEYIKTQVERFRSLGFQVWMDDFGSGYSSLDVLQSIKVNLIKFDMKFLQHLSNSDNSKIILTSLMRMANTMKIDTICEGVETVEQVRFLREIGCSKLQGYYFSKPTSFEDIMKDFNTVHSKTFDKPEEAEYYDTISRVNLYNLDIIANEDSVSVQNAFDVSPMAVLEINGTDTKLIRSNSSYREFLVKYYDIDVTKSNDLFKQALYGADSAFLDMLKQCAENDYQGFIDVKTHNNLSMNFFMKRVAINNVTNSAAIALVVMSIRDINEGTTYVDIARALATDYYNLFYVNMETEEYIQYSSGVGYMNLITEKRGNNFFAKSREDAGIYLYSEDVERFRELFTKENILKSLEVQGTFKLTYRMIVDNKPTYMAMKLMKMDSHNKYIIAAVSNVDAQLKEKEAFDRIKQESISYNRLSVLTGDYICMYTVDLDTDYYTEYSSSQDYKVLGLTVEGKDFFGVTERMSPKVIHPDDLERNLREFTKEKILNVVNQGNIFKLQYRLVINGTITPVILRAAKTIEDGKEKLIIGISKMG